MRRLLSHSCNAATTLHSAVDRSRRRTVRVRSTRVPPVSYISQAHFTEKHSTTRCSDATSGVYFPHLHLIAQGDWWVSVELADSDSPLCWQLSGGGGSHTITGEGPCKHLEMESPAGFCRRCKCVPSHSDGLICFPPPPLFVLLLSLIAFVV